ncbi:GFA family protein [Gallaecimonas sp. GXIMD4217]|uniref:GFA family protein n=1 Tax=Gallaecimonas sp. GXIMD4217 TaxID=3131927 RepID=UPI00311AEAD6
MEQKMAGGCLCGALRYEIAGKPFDADYCHCRQCQLNTGSVFGVWMDLKAVQVTWLSGELKEYASSEDVRRGFCPDCGTAMSYRSTQYPDYYTLAITTLDDPNQISPSYHIHTDGQLKWLHLADDCPRHPQSRS